MSLLMLILGALIAAGGVLMIGFGVPINEFSLGNTLIIAGTTAFVGGFIIIALAVATRQLRLLTDALKMPAVPRESGMAPEMAEMVPPTARMTTPRPSFPPRTQPELPATEPFGGDFETFPGEGPTEGQGAEQYQERQERPLPGFLPSALRRASEQPQREEDYAPRPPRHAQAPEPADRMATRPSRPAVAPRTDAAPKGSESPAASAFDAIWPAEPRTPRGPEPRRADAMPAQTAAPARAVTPPVAQRSGEPTPVSILNSGVVDGMAYTLYTDGSIEAELAEGVVRFGSIEELRNHLEKSA
jgi:hypothetical protein